MCKVYKKTDPSQEGFGPQVLECKAGDSFGELALMYNAPRAASVVVSFTFLFTLMKETQ